MRILAAAIAAVVATGAGLVLSSSHVSAQTAPPPGSTAAAPPDQVIVNAPHFRHNHYRLNVPPEEASLSQPVSMGDLDLRTSHGARELHRRVRMAANEVCRQLVGVYPHGLDSSRTCYRNAVAEAQPQVDAAIQKARGRPPGLYGSESH